MVPLFLIFVFLSSFLLAFQKSIMGVFFLAQCLFYGLALSSLSVKKLERNSGPTKLLGKIVDILSYFCIGNYGTLLGLVTFLSGKKLEKWDPVKIE